MNAPSAHFPTPTGPEADASRALTERIRSQIESADGWLPFDRYMELALFEPGLGYYANDTLKFGPRGDFETAAGLGDWLGRAIAELAVDPGRGFAPSVVVEIGAGSGAMAEAVLERLAELGRDGHRYLILEPSPTLRQRQQQRLAPFGERVEWIETLAQMRLDGAFVFANEVVDALPVERFVKHGGEALPLGVALGERGLTWRPGRADPALADAVRRLEDRLGRTFREGYVSELRASAGPWIASIAQALERGAVLLVDYGLVRREYYHEERDGGTLICHYRHRGHANPFLHPGLQDISAWVDFSACAEAAVAAGLTVSGFTTQAQFVLTSAAQRVSDEPPSPAAASALKTLILPGEMGEKFKVLWLTKGFDAAPLPGRDLRSRL
jgi:SAM-dependent MidA family methyltransferase